MLYLHIKKPQKLLQIEKKKKEKFKLKITRLLLLFKVLEMFFFLFLIQFKKNLSKNILIYNHLMSKSYIKFSMNQNF